MKGDLVDILLTQEQIERRLTELAADVDADFARQTATEGSPVLLVGVLKGAVMVMADFARRLHSHVNMDWMAVSSYGSGTKSSGVVRILKDLDSDVAGRDVLIVEDIIDSGLTLSWLTGNLRSRGAKSVRILTLLRKPRRCTSTWTTSASTSPMRSSSDLGSTSTSAIGTSLSSPPCRRTSTGTSDRPDAALPAARRHALREIPGIGQRCRLRWPSRFWVPWGPVPRLKAVGR